MNIQKEDFTKKSLIIDIKPKFVKFKHDKIIIINIYFLKNRSVTKKRNEINTTHFKGVFKWKLKLND